jgi:hypothetical protein
MQPVGEPPTLHRPQLPLLALDGAVRRPLPASLGPCTQAPRSRAFDVVGAGRDLDGHGVCLEAQSRPEPSPVDAAPDVERRAPRAPLRMCCVGLAVRSWVPEGGLRVRLWGRACRRTGAPRARRLGQASVQTSSHSVALHRAPRDLALREDHPVRRPGAVHGVAAVTRGSRPSCPRPVSPSDYPHVTGQSSFRSPTRCSTSPRRGARWRRSRRAGTRRCPSGALPRRTAS